MPDYIETRVMRRVRNLVLIRIRQDRTIEPKKRLKGQRSEILLSNGPEKWKKQNEMGDYQKKLSEHSF